MVGDSWLVLLAALGLWAVLSEHSSVTLAVALSALISGSLIVWRRFSLSGVVYRRRLSATRATFGETVELTTELLNVKPLPLTWLKVEDSLPAGLVVERDMAKGPPTIFSGSLAFVVAMLPYERITRRLRVRCTRRGLHVFGAASLESGDYLGALRSYVRKRETDHLLVFPKIFAIALGRLPSDQIVGRTAARRNFLTDPIRTIGARDYHPGDAFRTIDWRATARLGSLMVRVFEPSTTPALDIVLDLAAPPAACKSDSDDRLEFTVSIAASLANYAIQQRWSVGLRANASSGGAQIAIPPSLAPVQLRRILETLAHADARATCPLPALLAQPQPRAARGATLVLITAALDPELRAGALDLRRRGRAVVAIHATDSAASAGELPIIQAAYDSDWTKRDALVLGA